MREQLDNSYYARNLIFSELSEAGRNHLNIELNVILIGLLSGNFSKGDMYNQISELKLDVTGMDNLKEIVEKI